MWITFHSSLINICEQCVAANCYFVTLLVDSSCTYLLSDGGCQVPAGAVPRHSHTLGVNHVLRQDLRGQKVLSGCKAVQIRHRKMHLWIQTIPAQRNDVRLGFHGGLSDRIE